MSHSFRSRPFAAVLFLILSVFADFVYAVPPSTVPPEIQTILRQRRDNYAQGLREGNPALLAAPAADNVRLITEAQPTVIGPDHAAAYYRAFLAKFSVPAYQREATGQFDLGSRVVETGRFTQKLTLKASGQTFDLIGKYLEAWEKTPAGGLKLVVTAWNFDSWFANAALLRFPEVPSVRTASLGRAPVNSDVSLELAALGRLLETAIIEHDGALWARFYADDARLLANNSPVQSGGEALTEYITAHSRELPVFQKLDIRNDRIDELGDYVFEYASHVASWRNGDSSGVSMGKNLRIWRREPNHALKMIFQIGAYD